MLEIPLTRDMVALVDDEDEWLLEWSWYANEWRPGKFYAARKCPKVLMHRVILNAPDDRLVDHRNRNPLDNQRHNLRVATSAQNNQNTGLRADNKSGFKGVSWHQTKLKWSAVIKADGKQRHLGYFATAIEAAKAYDSAARGLHGDFAWLNFP